jgi:hypothetical protein
MDGTPAPVRNSRNVRRHRSLRLHAEARLQTPPDTPDAVALFRYVCETGNLRLWIAFGTMPVVWVVGWWAMSMRDPEKRVLWLRRSGVLGWVWFVGAMLCLGGGWLALLLALLSWLVLRAANRAVLVCPDCGSFVRNYMGWGRPKRCRYRGTPLVLNWVEHQAAILRFTLDAFRDLTPAAGRASLRFDRPGSGRNCGAQ